MRLTHEARHQAGLEAPSLVVVGGRGDLPRQGLLGGGGGYREVLVSFSRQIIFCFLCNYFHKYDFYAYFQHFKLCFSGSITIIHFCYSSYLVNYCINEWLLWINWNWIEVLWYILCIVQMNAHIIIIIITRCTVEAPSPIYNLLISVQNHKCRQQVGALWCSGVCSWLVIRGSWVRIPLGAYALRQGILSIIVFLDPGVVNGYLAGIYSFKCTVRHKVAGTRFICEQYCLILYNFTTVFFLTCNAETFVTLKPL